MEAQTAELRQASGQTVEMLEQLGISDPLVQKLVTMMEAQGGSEKEDLAERQEDNARYEEAFDSLKQENELLRRSNEYLLEQSRMLAAAIGACTDCWGEDPDCQTCEGEGRPGSFLPHRGCFEVFVLPVVDGLRKKAARKRSTQKAAETSSAKTETGTPPTVDECREKHPTTDQNHNPQDKE